MEWRMQAGRQAGSGCTAVLVGYRKRHGSKRCLRLPRRHLRWAAGDAQSRRKSSPACVLKQATTALQRLTFHTLSALRGAAGAGRQQWQQR